jgi:hypothetical protein
MNRHEKVFYDNLPSSLSHEERLEYMKLLGPKFEQLPPAIRRETVRQAYADHCSQYVVRHNRKLIPVPTGNVAETLRRLGIKIEAELTLIQ